MNFEISFIKAIETSAQDEYLNFVLKDTLHPSGGWHRARPSAGAAMRAPGTDSDVKAAMYFMNMVSKTCPGTSAERNLQYKHLVGQVWAHGPGVALVTPNLDTDRNPVLACVAMGPGRWVGSFQRTAPTRE